MCCVSQIASPKSMEGGGATWRHVGRGVRGFGALVLLVMACSKPNGGRGCAALAEAQLYEEAVTQCRTQFDDSGDAAAGAAAAKACYKLGRAECVLDWQQRLRGTTVEASVLDLAGYVRWQQGDAAGSIEAYERQLELHQDAGRHGPAARSAYSLYQLHREAGRFRATLEAAELALEEALAQGDDADMVSAAHEALYNVFLEIGHLSAAERVLEKKKALAPEDELARAQLELAQGALHFYKGRPALARAAFLDALALAMGGEVDAPRREFLRATNLNLVEVDLALGDLAGAAEHLELAKRFADPDGRYPTALLLYSAQLELGRDRPEEAVAALVEALAAEPAADWRWLLESRLGDAEAARDDEAAAEAAYLRSIDLLESLREELAYDELKVWLLEARRHPFEALFRLRARQGRHLDALEALERAKARTFLDAFVRSTTPGPIVDQDVESAAGRAETLLELLPALGRSPVVAPRSVAEVVDKLAPRHVLAYLETEDDLWLAALAHGQVRTRRLQVSHRQLTELVDRFLAEPGHTDVATDLGRLLVPRDLLPAPGTTLHVVTDGRLGRLPFAALRPAGRYLVEDYDVTYLPSLNAQVALLEPAREADTPPLAIGDPGGDLPSAAGELRWVAEHLGTVARLQGQADATALTRAASAEWLHLATHTGLGPRGPWLRLADGDLTADTIVRRHIGPRGVMLASCASAARRGRGLWGSLGAAFLVAGSESVVATLWSVEDSATHELVKRFYEEGGRHDPAGGLARAQRAWIAAGRPPATWAPFVHLGTAVPDTHQKGESL